MKLQDEIHLTTPVTEMNVVIRGYITGRIKQDIERVLLGDASIDADGRPSFTGDTITNATNKALELIVLSVDGQSDDVLNALLDLPEQDYSFVKAEVDKIQRPLADPTETNSQTGYITT